MICVTVRILSSKLIRIAPNSTSRVCRLLFVDDQIKVRDFTLRAFRLHEKSNKSDTPSDDHLCDTVSNLRKHR